MASLKDLERAKSELAELRARFDNYSGNNPNKYQADIKDAARRVRALESDLKKAGLIALSEQEELEKLLDAKFPDARSKQIVEYQGKRYQRRFFPVEKSRSRKTVTEWGRSWEVVEDR